MRPFALNNPHIGQAAVNCYERIISLGVVHGDVRLANIMVRNDGCVFLLDFALAMFRKDRSEDEWNKFVTLEEELFLIKFYLDEKKLRDRTPPEPYSDGRQGYTSYNLFVYRARESWRNRYYDRVYGGVYQYKTDEHGKKYRYDGPFWRLKPEAVKPQKRHSQSIPRLLKCSSISM